MPIKPIVEGRDIEGDGERARQQVSQRERERGIQAWGFEGSERARVRARERV